MNNIMNKNKTITHKIFIHNDDFNSFEFVIKCLRNVCGHSFIQAEQCAHIIHHNNKCCVKEGNFESLEKMNSLLLEYGLKSVLE